MKKYQVVKVVFSDGQGQFTDFFLSEVLAYRFGKEHNFTIANVSSEVISDVDFQMLFA